MTRPLEPFFAPSRLFGQKRTEWPPFEKFEIFLTLNLENFFYHIVITRANYKLGRELPKVWPDIEQTERLKFLNKTYFRISSKMGIFLRIEIFLLEKPENRIKSMIIFSWNNKKNFWRIRVIFERLGRNEKNFWKIRKIILKILEIVGKSGKVFNSLLLF